MATTANPNQPDVSKIAGDLMPIVWDIGRATASPYRPGRPFRLISPRHLYACWLYPLDLVWAVCPGDIKVDPFTGLPDSDGARRRCGEQYPVFYDRGVSARETVCPSPFCT